MEYEGNIKSISAEFSHCLKKSFIASVIWNYSIYMRVIFKKLHIFNIEMCNNFCIRISLSYSPYCWCRKKRIRYSCENKELVYILTLLLNQLILSLTTILLMENASESFLTMPFPVVNNAL